MSDVTVTRLESLSNEVLLDIFEYHNAYILCAAFYGLNRRFDALLRSCNLHILFDDSKPDAIVWNTLACFIDPSRIQSLSFNSPQLPIDERFLPSTSQTLHSLSLNEVKEASLEFLLQRLPLNQIKRLNICAGHSSTPRSEDLTLSQHGHRLVSLVNCSLHFHRYGTELSNISAIFLHLHRLSLQNFTWSSNSNEFLFKNTPNLRSLQLISRVILVNEQFTSNYVLKHVRELDIVHRTDPSNLLTVLALFPGLRRLHIKWGCSRRYSVLDGTQWQEFIEKHLPYLQQMTLDFDNSDTGELDEQIMKTFQKGEFWSKRQVVAKMKRKVESRYRQVNRIYFGRPWQF